MGEGITSLHHLQCSIPVKLKQQQIQAQRLQKKTPTNEKYQDKYTDNWENNKRAGSYKKELNRLGIDKEGSMEWLRRGQLNWDGERIIINAQDQGHYTNVFKKMAGLSQSDRCKVLKGIKEKHESPPFGMWKTYVRTAEQTKAQQST